MNFLISIMIAIVLVAIGRDFIKKHSKLCYIIATILSTLLVIGVYTGAIAKLPSSFSNTILPYFTKSTFATALFVIVMYTGAFKNGSPLIKFLMPIRAELSIIASILTLAHNISFGKNHFVQLFTNPSSMAPNMLVAAIISLILIAIMVPLMITSFPSIRKKMGAKKWKKLQKSAYIFYALIYAHVMLIMVPVAKKGVSSYVLNVLVYSIVFLTYGAMRVRKEYVKKGYSKPKIMSPIVISIVAFCMVNGYVFSNPSSEVIDANKTQVSDTSTDKPSTDNVNKPSEEVSEPLVLEDGIYIGSASGYNGKISVSVTVEGGVISNIEVTDHVDDEPFIDDATLGVVDSILANQNTDVDTVSGATYSSKGIINAIKVALKTGKQ